MKNKIESEGINVEYIIAKSLEDPVFVCGFATCNMDNSVFTTRSRNDILSVNLVKKAGIKDGLKGDRCIIRSM
jgi:hypothetical protein